MAGARLADALPRFSPEPLRVQCIRYIAANIDMIESFSGVDEESLVFITALILHNCDLDAKRKAKLEASGFQSVRDMLRPYKTADLIPDPAVERPTTW